MPLTFPDRFWWLQRSGGIVFAAGCLVAAIYTEIQAYGAYKFASQLPDSGITEILRNQALIILLEGVAFGIFAAVGVGYVRASFHARQRFRRRLRAIEGSQNAMPRASVKVDAGSAAELSSEPLEWLWRSTPSNRRIMTTLIIVFLLIFSPFIVLFLYLAYCAATNTVPIGSTGLEPISPLERVGLVAVTVFAAALLLFLVGFLISHFPSVRGRPYGVVASNEGLWYYPQVGKRRLLSWEEMRLLEVGIPKQQRHWEYKLYGCDTIATWREVPPSKWVSMGMTEQEFREHHQALLNLIVARTHLLPRTFDKKLAEADEGFSISRRRYG